MDNTPQTAPSKRSLPFQNLNAEAWINLGLVAVVAFYLLQFGYDLFTRNNCGNLGVDYCAYWSAGKLSDLYGYAHLYDNTLFSEIQKHIFPAASSETGVFHTVPYVYLPVFVLPFQLLSRIDLQMGFWIWTILNLAGFAVYLGFFCRKMTGRSLPCKLLLLVLLSLPVFQNLFWGQMNIFLGICAGEFLRAFHDKKPFRSGLWLAGWLVKPQLLILIVPYLLWRRSWKALAGLFVSSSSLLIISYAMAGQTGMQAWWAILTGSALGGAASNAEIMMNWRMLGLHISNFVTPPVGWLVIISGSIITIAAVAYLVLKTKPGNDVRSLVVMLGIFTGTCSLAWHAHFSMAIILIPLFIILVVQKILPISLLRWWVFLPIAVMLIAYALAALAQIGYLPTGIAAWLDLAIGVRGLLLNLLLLAWAVHHNTRNAKQIVSQP